MVVHVHRQTWQLPLHPGSNCHTTAATWVAPSPMRMQTDSSKIMYIRPEERVWDSDALHRAGQSQEPRALEQDTMELLSGGLIQICDQDAP